MSADGLWIGFAHTADVEPIAAVLAEAAAWMRVHQASAWAAHEIDASFVAARIAAGEMVVARRQASVGGVCTLARQDPEFWPEDAPGAAAYLHKLAVPRAFAGGKVTPKIIGWCAETARGWDSRALKLDCHPELSGHYQRLGFTKMDRRRIERAIGPAIVVDRFAMPLWRRGEWRLEPRQGA